MIQLIVGENKFLRQDAIAATKTGFDGEVASYSGSEIDSETWAQIVGGQSFFSSRNLIVIDRLSENPFFWQKLPEIIVDETKSIILIEDKLDKRSKTAKWLLKTAVIVYADSIRATDTGSAVNWLIGYAKTQQVTLSREAAREMVNRAIRESEHERYAIIDQERLARAIEQLRVVNVIDGAIIDAVLAPSNHDNIFEIFSLALSGQSMKLGQAIERLAVEQDGYLAMGLLASQVQQLVSLVLADDQSIDSIVKDLGSNPYGLRQLNRYAQALSVEQAGKLVELFAAADLRIKRGQADPWTMIKQTLMQISYQK